MSDEDYNPFAGGGTQDDTARAQAVAKNYFADTTTSVVKKKKPEKESKASSSVSSSSSGSSAVTPTSPAVSSYSSTYSGASQSELEQLRAALKMKDEEVMAQKAQMEKMQKDYARELEAKERKPNFPFFYPIVHIAIARDFPDQTMRNQMRSALSLWFLMSLAFVWGFVSIMIPFFDSDYLSHGDFSNDTAAFFLSLIWSLTGIPLSFYFWFFKLYELHRKTGAENPPGVSYWFWFFHGAVNVAWCAIYAIGPPPIPGMAGFVVATNLLTAHPADGESSDKLKLYGTFIIISATVWTIVGGLSTLMLLWVIKWYRAQGGRKISKRDIQRGVLAAATESDEAAPILSR